MNSARAGQAAKQAGITAQSSQAGQVLAGQRLRRIYVNDENRTGTSLPENGPLVVRQGKQDFYGQIVEINGPARVFAKGVTIWVETRSPVRVLLAELEEPPEKAKASPTLPVEKQAKVERTVTATNVKQFHQAIRQQRQVLVQYRSPKGVRQYTLIPLDVKGGRSERTKKNRYVWGYSEKSQGVMCLRLDRVVKVKPLAETSFDPADLAKVWPGKKIQWNLPRDWAAPNQPA